MYPATESIPRSHILLGSTAASYQKRSLSVRMCPLGSVGPQLFLNLVLISHRILPEPWIPENGTIYFHFLYTFFIPNTVPQTGMLIKCEKFLNFCLQFQMCEQNQNISYDRCTKVLLFLFYLYVVKFLVLILKLNMPHFKTWPR